MKTIISFVVIILFPFLTCFGQVQLSSVTTQTATYDSISGDFYVDWELGEDDLEKRIEIEEYHNTYDLDGSKKQVVISYKAPNGNIMERVFQYDLWDYDEDAEIYIMGSDNGDMLKIDLKERSIFQVVEKEVFEEYIFEISQNGGKTHKNDQIEIKSIHYETGIYDEVSQEFYEDWRMDVTELETIITEDRASDFFYLDLVTNEVKAVFKLENGEWGETIFEFEEMEYYEEEDAFHLGSTNIGAMRIDLEEAGIIQMVNGEYYKYLITDWKVNE